MHSARRAQLRRQALEERLRRSEETSNASTMTSSYSMSNIDKTCRQNRLKKSSSASSLGRQKGARQDLDSDHVTLNGVNHHQEKWQNGLTSHPMDHQVKTTNGIESSMDNLSEAVASVSLSSPANMNQRRPASAADSTRSSPKRCHVHFNSSSDGGFPRSSSIPVHLTISTSTVDALPASFRRDPVIRGQHDPKCSLSLDRRSPSLASSRSFSSSPSISGSDTLPRRHNAGSRQASTSSRSRTFSTSSFASSSNGANPSESCGYPVLKQPLRGPKRYPRLPLSTSMEIWEIQKQLGRGEMVQGVLSLGGGPLRAFGSRVPEKEETRICAPVMLGKTNGQMDWRGM